MEFKPNKVQLLILREIERMETPRFILPKWRRGLESESTLLADPVFRKAIEGIRNGSLRPR